MLQQMQKNNAASQLTKQSGYTSDLKEPLLTQKPQGQQYTPGGDAFAKPESITKQNVPIYRSGNTFSDSPAMYSKDQGPALDLSSFGAIRPMATNQGYGGFNRPLENYGSLGTAVASRANQEAFSPKQWEEYNKFGQGGAIPVSGRQVLGAGTSRSDSIPAVIDGTKPAALSTGEFVFPTEAVRFYGVDKLNKMIAKSQQGGRS